MERDIVAQRIKEFQIQEFIDDNLSNVGHSHTVLKKTPLGEKIIIHATRPGLIVGRKGLNIKELTSNLKRHFKLENPQIEISEVKDLFLNPEIVAEKIAQSLERFGSQRFKGIGHKTLGRVIDAGALGVEIIMSGKIPGSRARSWRFYQGYLKKCGDVAVSGVKTAYRDAKLKTGIIGIQVRLMPPNIDLPDAIKIKEKIDEQDTVDEQEHVKKTSKATKKKLTKKTTPKEKSKKAAASSATQTPPAQEAQVTEVKETTQPQEATSEAGSEESQEEENEKPTQEKAEAVSEQQLSTQDQPEEKKSSQEEVQEQ